MHTATSSRFSRRDAAALIAFVAAFVALLLGAGTATAATSADPWYVTDWGAGGSGDGEFAGPCGVAVDAGGDVYVTDRGNNRVQKFTGSGAFVASFGSGGSGDEQFNWPAGVAVDGVGNVYVVDWGNDRVQKLSSSGAFLDRWGGSGIGNGKFNRPFGIAVDGSGDVYVTDLNNHRVQKFTSDGDYITQWGGNGAGDGQFYVPRGVAVDGAGNVYVSDGGNHRIQKFTATGGFLTQWGSSGSGDGEFKNPAGIAVDAGGNVHVADTDNFRVQEFTGDGAFLTKWGTTGSGDAQFDYPYGIAVDGAGHMYVTDYNNRRVQQWARDTVPPSTAHNASPGWSRSATVDVVLTPSDLLCGVLRLDWRLDAGSWTGAPGTAAVWPIPGAALAPVVVPVSGQGLHDLQFFATDNAGNVEVIQTASVWIDSAKPTTKAYGATVKKGGKVKLRYQVRDALPGCGQATAKFRIFEGKRLKTTLAMKGARVCNVTQARSWRCTLPKGRYTIRVYATDIAGNPQSKVGSARLTVR